MSTWTFELRVNGEAVDEITVESGEIYGPDTQVSARKTTRLGLAPGDIITVWCTERPEPPLTNWILSHVRIRVKDPADVAP
jgi:hypothetical protein